ncbi:tyrosine-type recombinase/integrase [Blastochloris viridis]|uniref:Site-specific tyrosine recombinase XerC n=1 Tax=Blastochloris viridis TaxID=1079 RepID=A0A0P0JM19_BLAVI|nr:site-specific integrase [Blastochloris viridis]ALK10322.1 Tyrosine recombinase XerC [Blastochloris viridis]CUU42984.1 site-specific tyrosine recombinase XerC [Blastochloris viridis]
MATIRKRGDKWQVQVRRQGHAPITRSFLQKADAVAWARQTETKLDRDGLVVDTSMLKRMTKSDLVERYLTEVVPRKRGAAVERIILRAFLRSPLAKTSLSAVTAQDFANFRDERLQKVKASTLRREFGILSHCFEMARKEWSIPLPANPLSTVKLPKNPLPRDRRLDQDDPAKLGAALGKTRVWWLEPLVTLAVETGMRRGELVSIRWCDVDLVARTVHLPMSKNGLPRTVPLTPKAIETLEAIRPVPMPPRETPTTSDRVFPVTTNAVRLAWGMRMVASGIAASL